MPKQTSKRSFTPYLILIALLFIGGAGVGWFAFQLFAEEQPQPNPIANTTLNLSVLETGIHALSPADVRAQSGLNLTDWSLQEIALTLQGEPVPFILKDGQLIFLGQGQDSVYSRERVYQLLLGNVANGKAITIPSIKGSPTAAQNRLTTVNRIATFEQDDRYVSIARTDDWIDTWYWDQIHVSDFFQFEAELPHVANGSATLTSHLFGVSHDSKTDNDHDLDLLINDQSVGEILWDGNRHFVAEIDIPADSLKSGTNEIIFDNRQEGNAFIDISEVDWVHLTYPSEPIAADDHIHFNSEAGTLELSGFSGEPVVLMLNEDRQPTQIAAVEFKRKTATMTLAQPAEIMATGPDGWLKPESITPIVTKNRDGALEKSGRQIDLIIITDDVLSPEMEPLVAARRAQGLGVELITTTEIYNRFGFGQPSPQAIQSYLANALTHWPKPAPQYLLLAGGTTYDFRNNLDTKDRNRVPSMLIAVEHSGETVSDTRLADVDGDGRADISVGRWPANTPQEIASLVERTLAYEQAAPANNVLFTADGTSPEFSSTADRLIANSQLGQLNQNRAYGSSWQTVTDFWNSGNWIVTYVGHGSVDLWGQDEVLSGERVGGLQNPADVAPPIVLQFTCLTGYFAHPDQVSISERMLLNGNGPVITVSASSLTYSSSQEPFAASMLNGLTDPNMVRIGDVVSGARATLDITNPSIKEVYDTFNLLGDPSAIVVRP